MKGRHFHMITDSYDIQTSPVLSLKDFYGEQKHLVDKCLVVFSREIHQHLLDTYSCEPIGFIRACNMSIPIYKMNYKGENIAFYLTMIGSALASSNCVEANWICGATKFIMFGSCGVLDSEKASGKYIIPTESYRGEGLSYYYAPPADYITIKNSDKVAQLFEELKIPHVHGRVWTTDSMLRETTGLVEKRKSEGCIAVEMEVAGVQSVCDFFNLELYDFLEPGDVLDAISYEADGLTAANHNLKKLYIDLEIALRI